MKTQFKKLSKSNIRHLLYICLAFFLMVSVSYYYMNLIVQDQVQRLGEETMETMETAVTSGLTQAELVFEGLAHEAERQVHEGAGRDELLSFMREVNSVYSDPNGKMPDFMKIYGYLDKEFLVGSDHVPGEGYNPVERPWYVGAIKNKDTVFFSEPYIDENTGRMCISFSRQITDREGDFYGVFAIDLSLSRITDYVNEQQVDNKGYGVLITDMMKFISHRDAALIEKSMSEAGGDYAHLAKELEEGRLVSAERFTDVDGTDSMAFLRSIFNGWHIGIMIPRSHYFGQVYEMGIVLVVLGLVLAAILCFLLVRTVDEQLSLGEKSRRRTNFLARMSHEMRTPMTAIIGMTDIAQKSEDPDRIRYCLDKISDASNHLLGVINDMLDISRIVTGKLELNYTDFAVVEMLNRATAIVGFKIEERKQELEVMVHPDVPKAIVSDMYHLTQVLTNLLSNANKFSPEGGKISLSVGVSEQKNSEMELRFEVTDNENDFSEQQQESLLQSFEQTDDSNTHKYGGAGLGLAVSQNIITIMGGKIWIDSELNQGARFIFTLPVKEGSASSEVVLKAGHHILRQEAAGLPVFQGKCILLAEDIDTNREILIEMLKDTGVTIVGVQNGNEAVKVFEESPDKYDMIFMDLHMPEMDGYSATQAIRAMESVQARNIPIVAMTANVFQEDIDRCLAVGMNGHVGKPADKSEILMVMQELIE